MARIGYIASMQEWEQEFKFYSPVKVRFSETDMYGHLNNTVPFTYFEMARIEFFKEIGFMGNWLKPGYPFIPVVADLQCDFLKQVFFDEKLRIYVKANKIGNSSVDLHYMGKNEAGEVCFTGRGTMVQISRETGKGAPWTDEMKNLISKT
ncbi:acyl-CoA thioesterase [Neobacillus piezotolerans]|uniref:Acyl-CoA thioesterase n=1 Tax=Neobacillus piezotolerans TaxID=2259171 RepID=A0A3D8GP58_9BACI|nr:thioesterase family protein [Neobacillus piezotolerans]RDU36270.1 acyl-CoA thioesterase [Neobacillus piezotolerans]